MSQGGQRNVIRTRKEIKQKVSDELSEGIRIQKIIHDTLEELMQDPDKFQTELKRYAETDRMYYAFTTPDYAIVNDINQTTGVTRSEILNFILEYRYKTKETVK